MRRGRGGEEEVAAERGSECEGKDSLEGGCRPKKDVGYQIRPNSGNHRMWHFDCLFLTPRLGILMAMHARQTYEGEEPLWLA